MTDSNRVIYDIERCICHVPDACRDCSKYHKEAWEATRCMESLMADALELLKEQETIVRCKDCKYCEYPKSEKEWCKKGHLHGNAETWFCADGERR